MNALVLPFAAAAGANMIMFALVWVLATRIKNAGIVDIAWAFSFFVMQSIYTMICPGSLLQRGLLLVMIAFWSLRLTAYLFDRTRKHHPTEDARYAEFRREWQQSADRNFFFMFQFQAVVAAAMTIPFCLGSSDPSTTLHICQYAGLALVALGFLGETAADAQLASFKNNPDNKSQVCNQGLWRYSRHPNYFFEFVIWLGFGVSCLESPFGPAGLVSPLVMYCFLRYISGVPPAEAQSLKSRGDAYRAYQASTSVFFPWFPGRSK